MNHHDSRRLRVITKRELRFIVPFSPQHILRLEKRGKFPKRIQLGARRVGWYLRDIERWLSDCERGVNAAAPTPRKLSD
jgi:prophage regulatory protein